MNEAIKHVSDTAIWVATYRARESDRPDALFKDPLAKVLAGTKGEDIARSMAFTKWVEFVVVIRTVIIDNFIRDLIAGGVDTVVNLGAGLDTFRTEPPSADHPFWKEPRIVVTPHIGGVTREANARVGVEAVEGVLAILQGRGLGRERIVNFRSLAKVSA